MHEKLGGNHLLHPAALLDVIKDHRPAEEVANSKPTGGLMPNRVGGRLRIRRRDARVRPSAVAAGSPVRVSRPVISAATLERRCYRPLAVCGLFCNRAGIPEVVLFFVESGVHPDAGKFDQLFPNVQSISRFGQPETLTRIGMVFCCF
jgi:hypothetical protein